MSMMVKRVNEPPLEHGGDRIVRGTATARGFQVVHDGKHMVATRAVRRRPGQLPRWSLWQPRRGLTSTARDGGRSPESCRRVG
jgi:hypothetical protein